jgi:hypothetical protein
MTVDLQPFCSEDPVRVNLQKPFTRGDWTYATNGHILVRVPKATDAPEGDVAAEKVIDRMSRDFGQRAVVGLALPAPERISCISCDGRGREHECPDCECECECCYSSGVQWKKVSVRLRGAVFDARYLGYVLALPGVTIQDKCPAAEPSLFIFDGGEGVVMPMKLGTADIDAGDA